MPATGESPEYVQNILESLRAKKRTYSSGEDVIDSLGSTSLAIPIGPFGALKNKTIQEVIRISDEEDLDIHTITPSYTRARTPDDHPQSRTAEDGVTFAELNDAEINGNLVSFDVIGDDIEATYRSSFYGRYNIGSTSTHSTLQLMGAGFYDCDVMLMVTSGEALEHRLRALRSTRPDFIPKAIDGLELLDFAKQNVQYQWFNAVEILPTLDGPTKAARKVINIILHKTNEILTEERTLQYIDDMDAALKRVLRDVH